MAKLQIVKPERIINIDNPKSKKKKAFVPINELRNRAFAKLHIKEERVKFSNRDILIIKDWLNEFRPQSYEHYLGVIAQIEKDIRIGYKKYDALAMWLDSDNGLAKFEPDLIRNIAMECGLGN